MPMPDKAKESSSKVVVTICMPGYSLKTLCIRVLREFLTTDGVDNLCMPPALRKELMISMIRFRRYQIFNTKTHGYHQMLVG
ncbi:unnamed protein product [Soboliphyme baturini]|uniref:SOCS box domain-containing protein n=1 Tax=Soboliphyme baturini TaxID=241478 RepID=A0A183IYJ7_9BILA|nr:unnamed protein product [Soboliphyme baturini]